MKLEWNFESPNDVDFRIFTHKLRAMDRMIIKKSSHSPHSRKIYFRNSRSQFIDLNGFDKLLFPKLFDFYI